MEVDVPNEERNVASQIVYRLLAKFERDDFKLSDFFPETELQETMHIPTHLFSALKNCQQHAISDVSLKILNFLIENQQCGKQFLWKMFVNFLQKDCSFFLPLLSDFTKVFLKSQKVHHDELRLFHTVLLLNKEMYEKAHQEACNFNAKESMIETNFLETAKAASSALLVGYKTVLDYQTIDTDDDEMLNVIKESFILLFSKRTCEPLFAEPFTYILMKLKLQEEAETFLEKYVERESKGNVGISAALHALNIIKLHIPKAGFKLINSLLEMIAKRDSGNPKVLDLCQHHLNFLNSGMCNHSGSESDSDEGATSFATNPNGLNKCLQLMMYFLDVYVKHLPSAVIREGWSVMAEIMKRICVQEAKDCFQPIIDLWHNDRKRWWPCFRLPCSGLPSTLPTVDAELYSNKGIVCYVLESEHHPFVKSLIEHQDCHSLKSLMEQLRHSKIKFDSHINALQETNQLVIQEPLESKPIIPRITIKSPQTQMTPSLSRFNTIDSEAIAEEFPRYLLTTKRIKSKKEYKSVAKNHKTTKKLLKLDVNNMIARRYAKRRTIAVQNRNLRMTRAKRAATISVCSVESFDSLDSSIDNSEEDGDDSMTDGSLSQDDGDYNSLELLPNPCQPNENSLIQKRWTTFIKTGKWGSFSVDEENSSDEEYAPPLFSDEDSYSDEFDEFYEGEANTRAVIANNYPASIPSSYPSISPASSISGGYTPDLQFSDFPSQPRDVIRNDDHYRFLEFDSFSVCSTSTTAEIAKNITQVIRKLDVDNHDIGYDNRAEEYVIEEDVIPEEVLDHSSTRNNIGPFDDGPADEYYAVEEENYPTENTLASNVINRSFSRDFEASSPDMFASYSEDEDRDAVQYFDEKKECNENKGEDDNHRKAMNSTSHLKMPSPSPSASFVVTPSAVSTPIKVRQSKNKKNRSRNVTQNELTNDNSASDSRRSESNKTSKHEVSKLSRWDISLVDRVLKESLASEVDASSTSNLTKLSTLGSETAAGEQSCSQPVKKPRLSVVSPPFAAGAKSEIVPLANATKNKNKKSASDNRSTESAKKSKRKKDKWKMSLIDLLLKESPVSPEKSYPISNSAKSSTVETETLMVESCNQPGKSNFSAKELNSTKIHKKAPVKKTLPGSTVTTSFPVTTPLAVSTPKSVRKTSLEKEVHAKSKTLRLENKTNEQCASASRSSGSTKKSKGGVAKEDSWKMSLVDLLLKESSVPHDESTSKSNLPPTDETVPGIVTSTKKKSRAKIRKVASTSTAQRKSKTHPYTVDDRDSGVQFPLERDIDRKPTPCREKSHARKSHVRERDPDYLSASENESDVSASKSVLSHVPISSRKSSKKIRQ